MNLRKKVVLIVVALSSFSLLVMYAASQTIILHSFVDLEKKDLQTQIRRAVSGFNGEVDELDLLANDYATWDDSYQFITDNNTQYIESNLMDETFEHTGLGMVAYVDATGNIMFFKTASLLRPSEASLRESLAGLLSKNESLWDFNETGSYKRGVLDISGTTFLFASRPILTTNAEGPIRGAMIMGKELSLDMVDHLREETHLQITVVRLADSNISPDFQEALVNLYDRGASYIKAINNSVAVGYTIISDALNTPCLLMSVSLQRDIYGQGLAVIQTYTLITVGWFILFGFVTLLLVEKAFLSRMGKLTRSVLDITKKGDLCNRVPTDHGKYWKNDELSLLSTSVNRMLDRIQQMTNELNKAQRFAAVGELAVMIAHDLRNPLQGITIAADYLKLEKTTDPEKRAKMIDLIKTDVEYCEKIASDLLGYSKEIHVDPQQTEVARLLSTALSHVQIPRNVQVTLLTQQETTVSVDVEKMIRVFNNLIKNAFEAMPDGGSLTIKSEVANNALRFSFADTGVGIARENLDKLFNPLFTTKAKGMGFGLAICKRIVEAHNGRILADSVLGVGTTFTIELPVSNNCKSPEETAIVTTNLVDS